MNDQKTKTLNISNFALNLYWILDEKGITVEDFAEKVGVSSRLVYYWESGKKFPSLEMAIVISNVLEVGLDSILSER